MVKGVSYALWGKAPSSLNVDALSQPFGLKSGGDLVENYLIVELPIPVTLELKKVFIQG